MGVDCGHGMLEGHPEQPRRCGRARMSGISRLQFAQREKSEEDREKKELGKYDHKGRAENVS